MNIALACLLTVLSLDINLVFNASLESSITNILGMACSLNF